MKTLLITGVCGVGKSTITRELARILNCSWGDYADIMLEVMNETDKDKIQYLNWDYKERVINQTEGLIAKRFNAHDDGQALHLFENHLSIIQDNEIVTFQMEDYERYNTIGLVVVEALSSSIVTRRQEDASRKRLLDNHELIENQQQVNLREVNKVSSHLHIPWLRIMNNSENLPINQLEIWYKSLAGETLPH